MSCTLKSGIRVQQSPQISDITNAANETAKHHRFGLLAAHINFRNRTIEVHEFSCKLQCNKRGSGTCLWFYPIEFSCTA